MVDARIKNQNPGNMENTTDTWQGQIVPKVGRFANFVGLEWGLRAMFKDIRNKISSGRNTIKQIVSAWCPPKSQGGDCANTDEYISFVSRIAGVPSVQTLMTNDFNTLSKIATAITRMEHGVQLEPSVVSRGWDMVFGNATPPPPPAVQPPVLVMGNTALEPTVKKDLTPWYIGGAALLAGGYYLYSRK